MYKYLFLTVFLIPLIIAYGNNAIKIKANGTFMPSGSPIEGPEKKDIGTGCIVEMKQPYKINGTLFGMLEIDYRILVNGPCGKPPGTYDEEWIAYGSFIGIIDGISRTGKFSYTANVKAGGDVEGTIVFRQGIDGELNVKGNFNDGKLSYNGWLNEK